MSDHLDPPLLSVDDLIVSFGGRADEPRVQAVNGVGFSLGAGESLGFVGESGSGKSVTALSVMGLLRGANVSGSIRLEGRGLMGMRERAAMLRGTIDARPMPAGFHVSARLPIEPSPVA